MGARQLLNHGPTVSQTPMLPRILETEVMDTPEEARDYDEMDHREVNSVFVDDLLDTGTVSGELLDLGTGNARIPIELCRRIPEVRVVAVDLAENMLDIARINTEMAGLNERLMLDLIDAKRLPFQDDRFNVVISNSMIHHLPTPEAAIVEAVRVLAPRGLVFVRDLLRPADDATVRDLVTRYAGDESEHARQMFDDSLRAALTLEETRSLVGRFGFAPDSVQMTSDRHWTWMAIKESVDASRVTPLPASN